ncbi:MAG: VOC family protein [Weeksellaceae bacterium]|nr:VOC family protein [Weeksellaceae bacterium]
MSGIHPYLTFDGNCEEAFNFYKSVFGGEFTSINRFGDIPPQEGEPPMAEDMKNQIMHIALQVGDTHFMGSDSGGEWGPGLVKGNNFTLSVSPDSEQECKDLFEKLSEGGTVTMPMQATFWSKAFGMLTDQFGIQWMVSVNEHGV